MKKNSFTFPFKSNFFKEQDPFHLVVIFFIIFFGTAIFFSIPTFYDYKKYNQQIETRINQEFKLNFKNLENISFRFIPSPHLLIEKADLKIDENEKVIVSNLENIKVFISITELYKDNFKIESVHINKANFYLNNLSLKNLIQNLKKNIVNKLEIKKSSVFYKNLKNEVILISSIKNLDYKIDYVNRKKILKINGNIFDSNYEFKYLIDYKNPNVQNVYLELQNPNLIFENKLIENYNNLPFLKTGNLDIKFLNQKNILDYEIRKNLINFKNLHSKNSNFDLNGEINLHPFHFDLSIDIKKSNLGEIENFLYLVHQNKDFKFQNISGKAKINFSNIDNKFMKKGYLNLEFVNSLIKPISKMFYIGDFATLEITDLEYLENINQVLQIKIKTNIIDNEKFNRFLFNFKKNKLNKDKLFFTYQFNADTGNSFISQISSSGFVNSSEFYKFKNLQQLKNLLKDDKIFKLD